MQEYGLHNLLIMRDKIVEDRKYFEQLINEKDKLILKSKDGLAKGKYPEENIPLVKHRIFIKSLEKLIAMYSMGMNLEILKNEYSLTLSLMLDGWDEYLVKFKKGRPVVVYNRYYLNDYCYMVWMLSLAELLNVSVYQRNKLNDLLKRDKITDELIIGLSRVDLTDKTSTTTYKPFNGLFNGNLFMEINKQVLKNYLSGWYKNTKLLQWHNYKNSIDKSRYYFGYWSFETAAIIAILNLDDSIIMDNQYYPKDLVDYYRKNNRKDNSF